jgi:hypothetical protein
MFPPEIKAAHQHHIRANKTGADYTKLYESRVNIRAPSVQRAARIIKFHWLLALSDSFWPAADVVPDLPLATALWAVFLLLGT